MFFELGRVDCLISIVQICLHFGEEFDDYDTDKKTIIENELYNS